MKKKHNNGTNGKLTKLDLSYGVLPENYPFTRPKGFDPMALPWKVPDESIEEANSAFLFHRVPAHQRGPWMDELFRVLVKGGKCTFIVPYWTSARSIQDPMGEWPPLSENSFLYFNRKFREDNKLDYNMVCDFDFTYGYDLDQEIATKSDEIRVNAAKRQLNAINNLHLVLVKR